MTNAVDYEYWSDFLFREGAVCSPAELHGVLCATQCVQNEQWQEIALRVIDIPAEEASAALKAALEALNEIVAKALQDPQYGLRLILPDDALPVKDRCAALADWCHGYLHGFGSLGNVTAKRLDEEGKEVIHDIAKIAELDAAVTEDESSEGDFSELVEYVRIAVLAVYSQLNPVSAKGAQLH